MRPRTWAGLIPALLLTIVVGVTPSPARADGDPASDMLVNQSLFLPADAAITERAQQGLAALLDAASHKGIPIRVAIISSPADLGAVSELFDRPRAYVRFLGTELSLAGPARLLVVMPDGVGFSSPGHSLTAVDDVVGRIRVGRSGSALAGAAQAAVMFVAEAAHVHLVVPGRVAGTPLDAPTPWRPTTDRAFGVLIIAALAAVCAGLVAITRRRSRHPS